MDLVVLDGSRSARLFPLSEDNVRKQIPLPWLSFGSDAAEATTGGVFLESNPIPARTATSRGCLASTSGRRS